MEKVFVANRGEIATSIIRSAKKAGLKTKALWVKGDPSFHRQIADELVITESANVLLNAKAIVEAADGCNYLHPGYGFLGESHLLYYEAKLRGITPFMPDENVILFGLNKLLFWKELERQKLPVLPFFEKVVRSTTELKEAANIVGFPLVLKSNIGCGGKAIAIVENEEQLYEKFLTVQRTSTILFDSGDIVVQKFAKGDVISVAVLSDGNDLFILPPTKSILFRKFQKLATSTEVSSSVARKVEKLTRSILANHRFKGIVEIEFIESEGELYPIELNPRLPSDYHIINAALQDDIVFWAIKAHLGEKVKINTRKEKECVWFKVYAEDVLNNNQPVPDFIEKVVVPHFRNLRWYPSVTYPSKLPISFEALIGVAVAVEDTMEAAKDSAIQILSEIIVTGVPTNKTLIKAALMNKSLEEVISEIEELEIYAAIGSALHDYFSINATKPINVSRTNWKDLNKFKAMFISRI